VAEWLDPLPASSHAWERALARRAVRER